MASSQNPCAWCFEPGSPNFPGGKKQTSGMCSKCSRELRKKYGLRSPDDLAEEVIPMRETALLLSIELAMSFFLAA